MRIEPKNDAAYGPYVRSSVITYVKVFDGLRVDSGTFMPSPDAITNGHRMIAPKPDGTYGVVGEVDRTSDGDNSGLWAVDIARPAGISSYLDLRKLHVTVSTALSPNYTQDLEGGVLKAVACSRARGQLIPMYEAATLMEDRIRLFFRITTWSRRAPVPFGDGGNLGEWDGISDGVGGELGGWALNGADVAWKSLGEAHGFHFTATLLK